MSEPERHVMAGEQCRYCGSTADEAKTRPWCPVDQEEEDKRQKEIAAEPKLHVISLGAGVQSTVMALMSAEGAFGPVPDCAIFADTGWEPKQVYETVAWLREQLPFPIHVAGRQDGLNLLEACEQGIQANGHPGCPPPVFVRGPRGDGMAWRQCTREFKVRPIKQKLRGILGVGLRSPIPAGTVEQWLGISLDESNRMSRSQDQWITFRYPLIDKHLTRRACAQWFEERYPGRPLVKSACVGCPYHSAREWVEVRKNDPEMWERTVKLDASLRDLGRRNPKAGITSGQIFLHKRCLPLEEAVDLDEKALASRPGLFDAGGWGNECGGHCGV